MASVHSGRREAAVGGGPAAVGEENRSGHVAGGVRGEEQRRADHLLGARPALQHALVRVRRRTTRRSALIGAVSGVSTTPGAIALTRTPMRSELGRGRAHELHDAGLGRRVHRLAGLDDLRANRREDDDAAAALRAVMMRPGRLQHVEAALQVESDDAIELLAASYLQNRLPHVDARRADDDVEPPRSRAMVVERRVAPPDRRGCRAPPLCASPRDRPRHAPDAAAGVRVEHHDAVRPAFAAPSATASPMPDPPPMTAAVFPSGQTSRWLMRALLVRPVPVRSPVPPRRCRPAPATCRDRRRRRASTAPPASSRRRRRSPRALRRAGAPQVQPGEDRHEQRHAEQRVEDAERADDARRGDRQRHGDRAAGDRGGRA